MAAEKKRRTAKAGEADCKRPSPLIEAFEAKLERAAELDDPLALYEEYYGAIAADGADVDATAVTRLLERATQSFVEDRRYRNDPRYLRLWLAYAKRCREPEDIYAFLAMQSIAADLASYYEEYAAYVEAKGDIGKAYAVLSAGVDRSAQPVERLRRSFAALSLRHPEAALCGKRGSKEDPLSPMGTDDSSAPILLAREQRGQGLAMATAAAKASTLATGVLVYGGGASAPTPPQRKKQAVIEQRAYRADLLVHYPSGRRQRDLYNGRQMGQGHAYASNLPVTGDELSFEEVRAKSWKNPRSILKRTGGAALPSDNHHLAAASLASAAPNSQDDLEHFDDNFGLSQAELDNLTHVSIYKDDTADLKELARSLALKRATHAPPPVPAPAAAIPAPVEGGGHVLSAESGMASRHQLLPGSAGSAPGAHSIDKMLDGSNESRLYLPGAALAPSTSLRAALFSDENAPIHGRSSPFTLPSSVASSRHGAIALQGHENAPAIAYNSSRSPSGSSPLRSERGGGPPQQKDPIFIEQEEPPSALMVSLDDVVASLVDGGAGQARLSLIPEESDGGNETQVSGIGLSAYSRLHLLPAADTSRGTTPQPPKAPISVTLTKAMWEGQQSRAYALLGECSHAQGSALSRAASTRLSSDKALAGRRVAAVDVSSDPILPRIAALAKSVGRDGIGANHTVASLRTASGHYFIERSLARNVFLAVDLQADLLGGGGDLDDKADESASNSRQPLGGEQEDTTSDLHQTLLKVVPRPPWEVYILTRLALDDAETALQRRQGGPIAEAAGAPSSLREASPFPMLSRVSRHPDACVYTSTYYEHGSLGSALQSILMDEKLIVFFYRSLAAAVERIARANIVHGSLSLDHVMIRLGRAPASPSTTAKDHPAPWREMGGVSIVSFGRAIDLNLIDSSGSFCSGPQCHLFDEELTLEQDCSGLYATMPASFASSSSSSSKATAKGSRMPIASVDLVGMGNCLVSLLATLDGTTGSPLPPAELGAAPLAGARSLAVCRSVRLRYQNELWSKIADLLEAAMDAGTVPLEPPSMASLAAVLSKIVALCDAVLSREAQRHPTTKSLLTRLEIALLERPFAHIPSGSTRR